MLLDEGTLYENKRLSKGNWSVIVFKFGKFGATPDKMPRNVDFSGFYRF